MLEILVSTAIISIVMAALYSALSSNVEVIQVARESGEVRQVARVALDRISKDLASAYIAPGGRAGDIRTGMVLEDLESEGRPADRLDFTSLAHAASGRGGLRTDLCEIGYRLEEDPGEGGMILYRRSSGVVDDEITEGGGFQILALRVTGFDLIFRDAAGGDLTEWDSLDGEEDQANRLPSLIRVSLSLSDRLGREAAFVTSVRPELGDLREERW